MKNKDISLRKLPPHNSDAEKIVLGSIILDNDSLNNIIDDIEINDFYETKHQKIYSCILQLFEKSISITLVTICEELLKKGDLETIGGQVYMMDLVGNVPTSSAIKHHAKIVKDKSVLRQLIAISTQLNIESYQEKTDTEKLISRTEELLSNINKKENISQIQPTSDLVPQCFEMVEKIYEQRGAITGLETGYQNFDLITSGLQKSDLIIIAARPSVGKTSFALNIACNLAIKREKAVVIFSLETSKQQLTFRMLCSEARVSSHELKRGFLKDSDWPKLSKASGALLVAPIYIDDTVGITPSKMRAKLKLLSKKIDISLVIVDYLQLMQSGVKKENRQQEVTYISSCLKGIAREFDFPLIALCQLSRLVENRKPPKPILSDLRESGSIEQDADLVSFLYRPDYRDEEKEDHSLTDLIIAKHRNGPVGKVELVFMNKYTRFELKTDDWVDNSNYDYERSNW